MKGSKYIADTLKGYGVDHVFFMEAILRETLLELYKIGVKRVLTHSEKTAAYMADGYARASGRVGVCMGQSVGAANLASGLQEAWLANSPVLSITGKKPAMLQHRNSYQEINHVPLFAPVTRYDVALETSKQLPHILPQAFREAVCGCPKPVHLDMPDHQGYIIESGDVFEDLIIEKRFGSYPPFRPVPEEKDIKAAASALESAERPVLIVGGGAITSQAGEEIRKLAELLSLPVVTSPDGKSIIPSSHPLHVGPVGRYSRACANKTVNRADLVFYIGCNTGDQVTQEWNIPVRGTKVIQLDINPVELGRSYPTVVQLLGDAKAGIAALNNAVNPAKAKISWAKEVKALVDEWKAEMEPFSNSDDIPIRPERLCRDLSSVLPENAIVVADTGYSAVWTATLLETTTPDQRFMRCTGGSLGWAFPASLGVKCGAPDRPVICFTGDGGFWYHLEEMETASRCGINTVTIVNQNNTLGQVITPLKKLFGDRGGLPEEHYEFSTVKFSELAKNMGVESFRVEKPEEIIPALKSALSCGRPALVEVVTDPGAEPPATWIPPKK